KMASASHKSRSCWPAASRASTRTSTGTCGRYPYCVTTFRLLGGLAARRKANGISPKSNPKGKTHRFFSGKTKKAANCDRRTPAKLNNMICEEFTIFRPQNKPRFKSINTVKVIGSPRLMLKWRHSSSCSNFLRMVEDEYESILRFTQVRLSKI